MKTAAILFLAVAISLLVSLNLAGAYGGGGEGDAGETSTELRDVNDPPAGFKSSEVPTYIDPTKHVKAIGKITIIPASDKTASYNVDEAMLQNGDTSKTKEHGATITWPNGARIRVKPHTALQVIHSTKTGEKYNNGWFDLLKVTSGTTGIVSDFDAGGNRRQTMREIFQIYNLELPQYLK